MSTACLIRLNVVQRKQKRLDFGLFQATLMNTPVTIPKELVGKEIQAYIKKNQIQTLETLIKKT